MAKKPDILEIWSKKIKEVMYYYLHLMASNGEIIYSSRYKTKWGRTRAIKRAINKSTGKIVVREKPVKNKFPVKRKLTGLVLK